MERSSDDALQIFGGYGLCDEYLISKLYRDARVNRIIEGTNEIQRVVIAKSFYCDKKLTGWFNQKIAKIIF